MLSKPTIMKKPAFLTFILLLSFGSLFAQIQVPEKAEAHLNSVYDNPSNVHWEYREGGISAMLKVDEQLVKVFYEKDGQWRETRLSVAAEGVPLGVQQFIADNYQNGLITYAGLVKTPTEFYYRIESEYTEGVVIKLLTPGGQLVQEEWITYSK